jgi:serine/threonine-protein kinase
MQFGRYRILQDLGSGGMAVVCKALVEGPQGFSREVVVKRIRSEFASDPSFVKMLATEARLSAKLRHPNIVQVYEFGEVDGEYYVAMELVDGPDLRALLAACGGHDIRVPVGVACFIIGEVAHALGHAHALTDDEGRSLEIVHRDVSPSNIMVTPAGAVKLLDFGIAKAAAQASDERTRTGALKGKVSYLSPEQVEGLSFDHRSDLFALGVVFYELLTMERLFRGENEFQVMRQIREVDVPPLAKRAANIPPDLDLVVRKLLAREPAERFGSGEEVAAALVPIARRLEGDAASLRRFLEDLGPLIGRPEVRPPREPTATALPYVSTISRGELHTRTVAPGAPAGGSRALRVAAVAVVLLLAATIGRLSGRMGGSPPPEAAGGAGPATAATKATAATAAPASPIAATAASPATATAASPAAAERDRVKLRIGGTDGAEVLVDGALVGTVPLEVALPRLDGVRRVALHASGYDPWQREVSGAVDAALMVWLHRSAPSPRRAAPSLPPSPKRAPPADKLLKDPF